MATDQPAKKKRRIRPSSETVRQRTEKANQASAKPSRAKKVKEPRKVAAPLSAVARPFKWVGRHIIPRYLRNSFAELRNVTWPHRKQSRQLTTAVLMFAVVFGFLISALDYGLDKVFKKVFLHE
jgi:preprotein translocase SecE subunit